jgi:murein DD-endopeptidase MepM/ murein hydrolase activator NlpD
MSRNDATAPAAQTSSMSRIEAQPLPHLASADASYQPAPVMPAPPAASGANWSLEGGTAITVQPGETLETVAREHGVPVSAIMQANNIGNPASIYPGEHLVIPHYHSPAASRAAPAHVAAAKPAATSPHGKLVAPSVVHVAAAGETLKSIAKTYRKPVTVIASANNLPVDAKLKKGDRITVPDAKEVVQTPPESPNSPPAGVLAMAEPSQTVRVAEPAAPTVQDDAVKTAEPSGNSAGFRWPVRGRVIAAFGPKPNGVQNDGINLAVPEGTPVKAAEDGVVAYAGNELKGYGNLVLVRHANGFVTAYAHASDILVKRGEAVKRGQVIAHAGQTGNVTSPQLHFEIRKGATPVDPAQYLSGA